MPLQINRVALGLLSYFDSKNRGQPPQLVADQISGVVDLAPFFNAQQGVDLFGQVASAATGVTGIALASNFLGVGGGAFRVPPGEIWLVSNLSARMGALPAATEYQFTVGFQSPLPGIAGAATWHAVTNPIAVGAWTAGHEPISSSDFPFVMTSGDQVGIHIQRLALGTAQNVNVAARVVRLLI